jgi:hypothetical protein
MLPVFFFVFDLVYIIQYIYRYKSIPVVTHLKQSIYALEFISDRAGNDFGELFPK